MRHCQAGYGAQRCLSLHLCRGGRMMIFWSALLPGLCLCPPIQVVLLPALCRIARSGALVRGHEGQGALEVFKLRQLRGRRTGEGGGRGSQVCAVSHLRGRRTGEGDGRGSEATTLVERLGSATPVARHPRLLRQLHFLEPSHSTNEWLVHVPDIKCKGRVRNPSPVPLLPLSFCTSV